MSPEPAAERRSVAVDTDVDPALLIAAADTCPRSAITLEPLRDRREG